MPGDDYGLTEGQASSFAGPSNFRATESSQKLPLISVGNVLPRTRIRDNCTIFVSAPLQKVRPIGCQGVVPTVDSVIALGTLE